VSFIDPLVITYGRFLDQSTFGLRAADGAHSPDWDSGFPRRTVPDAGISVADGGHSDKQRKRGCVLNNALNGQDQCVNEPSAMSEFFVETSDKNYNSDMMAPWLQLLSRNAFGTITLFSKSCRLTLQWVIPGQRKQRKTATGGANENYAREVMQLFSVGLYQMNQDGHIRSTATIRRFRPMT